MKKLATLTLALTFAFGSVAVAFAQGTPKKEETKKSPQKRKSAKRKEDAPKKEGGTR